jgi:response regulator RpfG family c-di-GMP phosphodiesterase
VPRKADLQLEGMVRQRRTAGSSTLTILSRLARLGCRVAQVERGLVLLPDPDAPGEAVVAAVHGIPEATLGKRVALSDGLTDALDTVGPAILARPPEIGDSHARSGAVVPIRRNELLLGLLVLITRRRLRRMDPDTLDDLGELAELGSSALAHVDTRAVLESAVMAGADALARAVDMRDAYTARHSLHVVDLARRVGERLGLRPDDIITLELASRLHDIGKIGVPDAILRKPGPLSGEEWNIMRLHPVWGARVLGEVPGLDHVSAIVRGHHERWDGRGYPDGLEGDAIPLAARVISACDAFHAMIADRPYRPALDVDAALRELVTGAGSQFDPAVVEELRRAVAEG